MARRIPPREPDPNPALEARLRRIDEMQATIEHNKAQILSTRAEIVRLHGEARRFGRRASRSRISVSSRIANDGQRLKAISRADELQNLITQLEADNEQLHNRIIAAQDEYIEARQRLIGL